MKTTKCDRCGAERIDNQVKDRIGFYTLRIEISYLQRGFNSSCRDFDICENCKDNLDLRLADVADVASKFIKEMPEEKG